MDFERELYENGDVQLEVRSFAFNDGVTGEAWKEYHLVNGRFAFITLTEEGWAQLRELLTAYWEETDGTDAAGRAD